MLEEDDPRVLNLPADSEPNMIYPRWPSASILKWILWQEKIIEELRWWVHCSTQPVVLSIDRREHRSIPFQEGTRHDRAKTVDIVKMACWIRIVDWSGHFIIKWSPSNGICKGVHRLLKSRIEIAQLENEHVACTISSSQHPHDFWTHISLSLSDIRGGFPG